MQVLRSLTYAMLGSSALSQNPPVSELTNDGRLMALLDGDLVTNLRAGSRNL